VREHNLESVPPVPPSPHLIVNIASRFAARRLGAE
jgi:hypothetical protein